MQNRDSKTHPDQIRANELSRDTIILVVIVWMLISRFFWAIIPKLFESYYSTEWFKPVNALMNLVWAIIPLGLAFTIKDKSKQSIVFVLAALYLIHGLYETALIFL